MRQCGSQLGSATYCRQTPAITLIALQMTMSLVMLVRVGNYHHFWARLLVQGATHKLLGSCLRADTHAADSRCHDMNNIARRAAWLWMKHWHCLPAQHLAQSS